MFGFGYWELFHLVPVSFPYLHYCCACIFSISIVSATATCSSIILYMLCPSPGLSIAPKNPGSFHWRMVLETKIWALDMLSATKALLFLCLSAHRVRKHVYILTRVCVFSFMCLSMSTLS